MPTKELPKRKQGEARWVAHDPSWWEQLTTPLLDKPAQPGPAILHYLSSPLDIASGIASLGTSAVVAPAVRAAARVPSAVVNAIEAAGSAPLMGEGMREFLGGVRDRDPWAAITGLGQTALGGLGIRPASQDAWTVLTRPGTSTGRSRSLAGTTLGYNPSRRDILRIQAVQDAVDAAKAQNMLTTKTSRPAIWVTDASGEKRLKILPPRWNSLNPEFQTSIVPSANPVVDLLKRTEEIAPVKLTGVDRVFENRTGKPTFAIARDHVYETTPIDMKRDFRRPWFADVPDDGRESAGPWVMDFEAQRVDPTVKDTLGHLRNWFDQRVIKDIAAETAREAGRPAQAVLEEVQKHLDEASEKSGPVGRLVAELQKRYGR